MNINQLRTKYWLGGLALLTAALLYLFTLDNGLRPDELTGGDLITHQYAQVEGRPSNAPGYPLYVMGGWVWFWLGRALLNWALNPTEILSLYSTGWALAALWLLYLVLLRVSDSNLTGLRDLSGLRAGLLTAFYAATYFFWYYSVTTEQYTSAVFQTLLVIWLAWRWEKSPRDATLRWLALVSGTMLANMLTTVFIVPPLLWFIFFRRDAAGHYYGVNYFKRPRLVLQTIGLALLPLLSYGYVYIRGAQRPEWRGAGQWPSAWAWFVQFMTIQQGRDELAPGLTLHNFFTPEFPALIAQELTWLVFLGGLAGLACLGRRKAIFLYSTLIIYLIFSWGYRFGNWFQVIIPAYPIFIIGFAAGLKQISVWAIQRINRTAKPPLLTLSLFTLHSSLLLILTLLLIYRFSASLPRVNQHSQPADTGLDPGWLILADRPTVPAIMVGDFGERVALQYLTTVWGVAPGLYPTTADRLTPPPKGEQIYLSRAAAAASFPENKFPQAAGEQLIALWPTSRAVLPASAKPVNIDFGHQLNLVGWELVATNYPLPPEVAGRLRRANWQIALYWQAPGRLDTDYTISVRPLVDGQLITAAGTPLIQDHQPIWGFYPTSAWTPGEMVRDVYALTLPDGVSPDTVQIVVYKTTSTGFENLAETTLKLK